MRRRATIKAVYTMCKKSLGGKQFGEYTPYDRRLRFQRSVLKKCWELYGQYVLHQSDVMGWIKEFDRQGDGDRIVADTWRWVLEINKKLPVRIQRQRYKHPPFGGCFLGVKHIVKNCWICYDARRVERK